MLAFFGWPRGNRLGAHDVKLQYMHSQLLEEEEDIADIELKELPNEPNVQGSESEEVPEIFSLGGNK